MDKTIQQKYTQLLTRELIPALGCTEPIAIALAAAKARELLGAVPERITVSCSANIIKNAKSVLVPMSNCMKGIEASALLGAVGGNAALGLEVLSEVTSEHLKQVEEYIREKRCRVVHMDSEETLDILVDAERGDQRASARICRYHTEFVYLSRNGEVLLNKETDAGTLPQEECELVFEEILDYCRHVPIGEIEGLIGRQLDYNCAISTEGLTHDYGACVGKALLRLSDDLRTRACAVAAAGSDARMNGCTFPVIILSGSGNQGITACLPVVTYAKAWQKSREEILRAVAFSNLIGLMQKKEIGRLSAYCGAVCAACASGAAIAYLHGDPVEIIQATIINTLGTASGIVCDGAKASCAAKIASAVDAALLGYEMACMGKRFAGGDGIVKSDLKRTVSNVGRMAKEGMAATDKVILDIMLS